MELVRELRAFLRAALYAPVPRDHTESDAAYRRRRVVATATLVVGALVLAWTLRIEPGDPAFYAGSIALGVVWMAGSFVSGTLHLGFANTRAGNRYARPWVQSLALGSLLVAVFVAGALVVGQVPFLRRPIDDLLDHARFGSLAAVAVITAFNGVAEELFFRGGLYAAIGRHHAVAISTIVYAAVTAGAGNPWLVLAAAALGLVTGLQRRVTGGVLGPIITHVMWSGSMLFLLPPIMEALR